jgi:DNA (cytosine-5)-methyltransferase 1
VAGLCTKASILHRDVRSLNLHQWANKVDLVSGGPPCQPFSIGGKHRGHADSRDMFPYAAHAIATVRPKAFIFENVRGLLRKSFASYFEYILLQLQHPLISRKSSEEWWDHRARLEQHHTRGKEEDFFYRVVFQKINAADYGVPQIRERVVIVGFRNDVHEAWCFPTPTHSEAALEGAKWVTASYWEEHRISKRERPQLQARTQPQLQNAETLPLTLRWQTVRDALRGLPDPRSPEASRVLNHRFQPGAKQYIGHTGSELDQPAKTLKAGDHGVPGGENMLIESPGRVRYFTVRESARIQTFPDWYIFPCSWTESMRQIGNAVPVHLATIVGASVAAVLDRHQKRAVTRN